MDPRTNPYAPGAGTPPPELAGRDDVIEEAAVALDRIRGGLAAKSLLMVGLRGVGKTVLLNRICRDAEIRGFNTLLLEAPEHRSLPGLLAAPLHSALLKMSRRAAAGDAARRALSALGHPLPRFKMSPLPRRKPPRSSTRASSAPVSTDLRHPKSATCGTGH